MASIDALKARITAIDKEIGAVEDRLPAHSVKPPIMVELFALEEERERLLKQLADLSPPS